jgi:sulfate transport system permease protein
LPISARTKWSLRTIALLYLLLLLLLPVVVVFFKTFQHGWGVAWGYMTTPAAISALWLSLLMAAIAVPLNTIFGVGCALVLVRRRGRAAAVLDALIDLPFLVSPIVIGLALTLVYGIHGWFGTFFSDHGVRIIYAVPGMVLATIFVSLPFVVREVAPVLREVGDEQEQAAATLGASSWQTFWRITLPSIKWAVVYGVVLSLARSLGEFGAVKIVAGNVKGKTQTATLLVEQAYQNFHQDTAYAVSFMLAFVAVACIVVVSIFRPKGNR